MKELIALQFIFDLVIFFLIFSFILKPKGKKQEETSNNIVNVTDSLVEILKESENVSKKLADLIAKGNTLEENKTAITLLLKQSNSIITKLEKSIPKTVDKSNDSNNVKEYIYKLKKEGYTTQEIVKKTGVPEGEVELILNLSL